MAPRGHPFCKSMKVSLVHVYIIEERVSGVSSVIVVVAGQGQRVGMTCRHAGRYLDPGRVVGAGLGQDGGGRITRVVLECRGRPVVGHRVRAMHLIPEAQGRCSARYRERLADSAIAIGGRGATRLTRETA